MPAISEMEFEITSTNDPPAEDLAVLRAGLGNHGETIFGTTWEKAAAYFLRDPDGTVCGGVYGFYGSFGWLYIDTLWVSKELRGAGHAIRLMQQIESEAAAHGCTGAYLNTFSFQAPDFYKKLGYTVFGELEDFPTGYTRLFLRKKLAEPAR
jgi:GNAT superfamily N-acetyltransferase